MPIPATDFWSDLMQQTLGQYDDSLLRQVAGKLVRPRNQWPADELIERSLATLGNVPVIDRRLKELEPASRRLLALIGHSRQPRWHLGSLIELLMALGHEDGLPPILALLEAGLLFPCLPEGVKRLKHFEQWLGHAGQAGLYVFAPPQVTARALGEDLGLPDLSEGSCAKVREAESGSAKTARRARSNSATLHPAQVPALSHSATHEADGLEWPLRLGVLWQIVANSPLRRTQQGEFFKRDAERLVQDSLLNGAPADSLADLPDAGLLVCALADAAGILEDQKGELRAGQLPSVWEQGLLPALESLWTALPNLDTWNPQDGATSAHTNGKGNPYPSAYLLALLLLAELPDSGWADPLDLEDWLFSHHPYWSSEAVRPSQRQSWLPAFLLGLAYQLRLVGACKAPDGAWRVRLTPIGRWLLGLAETPPPPSFPQTLLVQPNLEVLAYRQGLTPALIASLTKFATWKSLGAACTLQLEPASVYRALQSGQTFTTILQTLERFSAKGIPPAVVNSLRTWADKRERITVYPAATLFEFASALELGDALSRGLPGIRVGERLAIVGSESSVDFRHFRLTGTRDYALPPEKCVAVEADGVTLSIDLARSDLLVESELARFAEPLGSTVASAGGSDAAGLKRQYRMTLASVTAGRERGVGLRTLEQWFPERTGQPVSPAARLLLAAGQLPPVTLRRQLVLTVATAELADGLLQWPATKALIDDRLGPTTLVIAEENVERLQQKLQELGSATQM